MRNFRMWMGLFLISFLFFSGCGGPSVETKSSVLEIPKTFQAKDGKFYSVFLNQKKLFDEAFQNAKKTATLLQNEKKVSGAIIAANLAQKEELAAFFSELSKNQQFDLVVVLSPTNAHSKKAFSSLVDLKTPYGLLEIDRQFAYQLSTSADETLARGEDLFVTHSQSDFLAPFVKKSFPRAKYFPMLINDQMSAEEADIFAKNLVANLPANSLILAQTTLKPATDPLVQSFQLQFTKNVLGTADASKVGSLPLYGSTPVKILLNSLQIRHQQKSRSAFWDNEKSAFLQYYAEGAPLKKRSTFLVSFGDLMLGRAVRSRMDKNGLDYPFEKMDKKYLETNDLLMANLEGPIATKAIKTSKAIAFRFLPDVAPLLKKYSFDALSEANNHAADMGWAGYEDSFHYLQKEGILVFGHPRDINEKSVAFTQILDQKIAFIGFDDVDFKLKTEEAFQKIKDLTAQGYKVIPFFHWGVEYVHKPNARQQDLARRSIDAGAFAVIGCHPHVVQSYETYKGRPIFYSLGNAVFDQEFSPATQEGLSIAMAMGDDGFEIYFLPIKIDRSQMRLMNEKERKAFLERFVTYGNHSEEERRGILGGRLEVK
jgi:poly-gamma-glutamate capsule biosynthesis protein CapA/YwtB (metallophosphatase superfamily)